MADLQFYVYVPVTGRWYCGVQQGAEEFYGYGVGWWEVLSVAHPHS